MNVSVGALFAAGIVPGLLIGVGLMLVTHMIAKRETILWTAKNLKFHM